jgi:hypothetical protein
MTLLRGVRHILTVIVDEGGAAQSRLISSAVITTVLLQSGPFTSACGVVRSSYSPLLPTRTVSHRSAIQQSPSPHPSNSLPDYQQHIWPLIWPAAGRERKGTYRPHRRAAQQTRSLVPAAYLLLVDGTSLVQGAIVKIGRRAKWGSGGPRSRGRSPKCRIEKASADR